jgi:lysophospholipase L1-like esterase
MTYPRRRLLLALAGALALLPSRFAAAQQPRPDPALAPIKDDPALPRVLLIGDSISIGYTLEVRRLLAGKANVHRIPANGGPTTTGLARLQEWLGTGKWDVIHFNWGLHDLKIMQGETRQVPLDAYERNLRELVGRLKATGARLIWAATTPVPEGKVSPRRDPADVPRYNAAALKVMAEHGVTVNDLYTLILPDLGRLQRPVNVHFTAAGSEALARRVAAVIEEALPRR